MLAETFTATLMGAGALAAGGFVYAKSRRARLYRALTARVVQMTRAGEPDLAAIATRPMPSFTDRLAVIPEFLPAAAFAALAAQAEQLLAPERSFVPTHKQGGTVAYETLIEAAPAIVACYHAHGLQDMLSRLVGARLRPTPIYDQSSLSVLVYNKPGDHIGWHYDHNFYRGRHFTVLLAIRNAGQAAHGLSHAVLHARVPGREIEISTAPNTLVVFEGARVRHRVTPIRDGERRIVLSMTYCTDPRAHWWQAWSRRLKDTAFFGLRALWT
ncbi:MAG TPA: 2OG-Fe(II) oxygenase [Xanthobacteraceae bacterium]